MNLQQLREAMQAELRAAMALAEKAKTEGLTDELKTQIEEHRTKAAAHKTEIQRIQDAGEYLRSIEAEYAALQAPGERRAAPMPFGTETETRIEVPSGGDCRAFEAAYSGLSRPAIREKAYRAGMWVGATIYGDEHAKRWCKDNGVELRVMSNASNGAGGYAVPDEMSSAVIQTRDNVGLVRRNLMAYPMHSDSQLVPKITAGLTVYYPAQGVACTESDLTLGQCPLTVTDWMTLTQVSRSFSADAAIPIANIVAMQIGYAFARAEDTNVLLGTGAAGYAGITGVIPAMEAVTNNAGIVAAATNHNTVAEIDAADIRKLLATLPDYASLSGPKWYCSKSVAETVFGALKMSAGGVTLDGSLGGNFLGYPIETSEVLPKAAAAASTTVLLFGHLDAAVAFGERSGIEVAQSEHRYFAENSIGIRGVQRVAATCHTPGTATVAGPIVGLQLTAS